MVKPETSESAQQHKWNRRYQDILQPNKPAEVLTDNWHLLPRRGIALELACGLGGNALALARFGLTTHAWDLSATAIAKLQAFATAEQLQIETRTVYLSLESLPPGCFDVICVSHFLDRSLCPAIMAALKPAGILLYQTYTRAKQGSAGPSSPSFLLEPGELLQLFSNLSPLAYREERDAGDLTQGLRDQAYLVARK